MSYNEKKYHLPFIENCVPGAVLIALPGLFQLISEISFYRFHFATDESETQAG